MSFVSRSLHAPLNSRRSLRPPRSCFDPNFSPKIFDKVPLCSTRGSCFQRKSRLLRQDSRSFQGYSWFLQFSRPFQDLENGFRNSLSTFQGPYAPCCYSTWQNEWMQKHTRGLFVGDWVFFHRITDCLSRFRRRAYQLVWAWSLRHRPLPDSTGHTGEAVLNLNIC